MNTRQNIGNKVWGIILVILGIAFAGNAMDLWDFDLFFDGWWTLFIIVPCVINIVQTGFHTGNTVGIAIGFIFFLEAQDFIPISLYRLIWPAMLIVGGLLLLFHRPRIYQGVQYSQNSTYETTDSPVGGETTNQSYYNHTENTYGNHYPTVDAFTVFGSISPQFAGMDFHRGSCTAVFGGVRYDLRGANITHDVRIDVTSIFGGVDVLVDDRVQVRYSSVPIFGGVDCKIPPRDPALPTVFVNCVSIFGGTDIK